MIIIHANLCTHINTHTHRKSFASSIRIHSYLFYCKNALECGGKYTTACSRYCGSARVRQRVAAIWYVKYFQEFFVSILFIKKKETKKIRSINNQFLNVSLFSYLVLFFCFFLFLHVFVWHHQWWVCLGFSFLLHLSVLFNTAVVYATCVSFSNLPPAFS